MIKIEYNGKSCKISINGKPDVIATEFENLCECLLEQGFFNASDLTSMLAIACGEKKVKMTQTNSRDALKNLLKKL